jgi:hypothetical protein
MICTLNGPARELAALDGLVEIALGALAILPMTVVALVIGPVLMPCMVLKWNFTQKTLAGLVDEANRCASHSR